MPIAAKCRRRIYSLIAGNQVSMYIHNFLRRIDWWSQIWRNFSHFGLTECRILVGLWNLGGQIQKIISKTAQKPLHSGSEVRISIAHRIYLRKCSANICKKTLYFAQNHQKSLKIDLKLIRKRQKCQILTFFDVPDTSAPQRVIFSPQTHPNM